MRLFQLSPEACKTDLEQLLGYVRAQCEERGEEVPAAKNLSPPPDSCRQANLRFLCGFLPPGETLQSGLGTTFWVPKVLGSVMFTCGGRAARFFGEERALLRLKHTNT